MTVILLALTQFPLPIGHLSMQLIILNLYFQVLYRIINSHFVVRNVQISALRGGHLSLRLPTWLCPRGLVPTTAQALSQAARSGKSAPKLGTWTPNMGMDMMIISLGRQEGICRMGGNVCSGCLPTNIKSKGLFIDKTRAQFGL